MICVIDFETSGLPPKCRVNNNTYSTFPRAVQVCCLMYDEEADKEISRISVLLKIADFTIPEDSIRIHKITNEMAQQDGVPFEDIYERILEHLSSATKVVGHNISFDLNIMRTELYHLFHDDVHMLNKTIGLIDSLNSFCTLHKSTKYCGIEAVSKAGRPYIKFPTLLELHKKLFDEDPDMPLHSADADCEICLKCFLKLQVVI